MAVVTSTRWSNSIPLLARDVAGRLGMNAEVQQAVAASYERWDGKGWPGTVRGTDIPIAERIIQLAEYVEVAHRLGGPGAACALARKRAGGQFDPYLAGILCGDAEVLFADLASIRSWQAVITAEPALGVRLRGDAVDAALVAIADFVDLKSPYTLGHSRAVAGLAADAGTVLGLPHDEIRTLRRAGLVHDLGRLGISNSIWDKRGPLSAGEWERVRMHPYLTERMLCQSAALAPLGQIAAQHHERIDGSGYPGRLCGTAIVPLARILGAADAYQTLREPRPYRTAVSADAAAERLRADARAERLDALATQAVLQAAAHRPARQHVYPAGLTAREVEVLRLLARGMSSKQIASRLVLAPKTVRNHTEHIYAKTGASNRVSASLFAVQHGLLIAD